MKIKMSKKLTRTIVFVTAVLVLVAGVGLWMLYKPMVSIDESAYVYIDNDDNYDSVVVKIADAAKSDNMLVFNVLAGMSGYKDKVRTGRYEVAPNMSALALLRRVKNGEQSPVLLTIPSTWTKEMVAQKVAKQLMADSASLASAMNNPEICAKYGMDTISIVTILIPNTYEVYWNIAPDKFVERMHKEYELFWNKEREAKAAKLGMSRLEVMTLASIVDAETANNAEKPIIAGLYLNRLKIGMPLQADPTVKYAIGDFALRRITGAMLRTPSPYNTYLNKGLPPSPIRVPAVASIEAALNHVEHNYLYMCAKEDFSGTHNYATTYAEHMANARRYINALNARNIK